VPGDYGQISERGVPEISHITNVTPAQAGVQFKDAWIPACAGMTDRYHSAELNNILEDISATRHQSPPQKCLLPNIFVGASLLILLNFRFFKFDEC
jgi:hypothetical protein